MTNDNPKAAPHGDGRQVIVYICHVTSNSGLNIRTQPNTESQLVFNAPCGMALNYYEKVHGETIDDNNCWGHSVEDHYYWLGGTDSPWC